MFEYGDFMHLIYNGEDILILNNPETQILEKIESTYDLSKLPTKTLAHEINSKKFLAIYDKLYELNDKSTITNPLKVITFTATEKVAENDVFHASLETPVTTIHETQILPKKQPEKLVPNFNLTEIENHALTYQRARQDYQINWEKIELDRAALKYQQDLDRKNAIINITSSVVNTIAGAAGGGVSIAKGGFGVGMGIGMLANAFNSAVQIAGSAIEFMAVNERERQTLKMQAWENHKLDVDRFRMEEDNKRHINNHFNQQITSFLSDRDIMETINKELKVKDIHIKKLTPNTRQINLINEHYAHYGIDCHIDKFTFT